MTDTPTTATETPAEVTEETSKATEQTATETQEAPTEEASTEETTEATQEAPTEEASTEETAPVNLDKFYDAYAADGSLTDEHYSELEAMGFPREMVDLYISGHSNQMGDADVQSLIEKVGGQETFEQIKAWAGEKLTDEELDQFNTALSNKTSAPYALETLKTRMQADEGYKPQVSLEGGNRTQRPAVEPFEDRKAMQAAIRDPRYSGLRKDPDYVKEVERRIVASNF